MVTVFSKNEFTLNHAEMPHHNVMKTTVGSTAELMVSDTVWMAASNSCCKSAHPVFIGERKEILYNVIPWYICRVLTV